MTPTEGQTTTPSGADVLALLDTAIYWATSTSSEYVRVDAGKAKLARTAVAALISRNAELEAAIHRLIPHTQHADSCGDMDAYNNADVGSCGCGLDSAIEFAAEALARTPAKGNDSCDSAT